MSAPTTPIAWSAAARHIKATIDVTTIYGIAPGHRGPCPLHNGTKDSFAVNDTGGWRCYSDCGTGGDVLQFYAVRHHGLGVGAELRRELFKTVVTELLQLIGAPLESFPAVHRASAGSKPYPSPEEIESVLAACDPMRIDSELPLQLSGRVRPGIPHEGLLRQLGEVEPLVLFLPKNADKAALPKWAHGWRGCFVIPMRNELGELVSFRCRPQEGGGKTKERAPSGRAPGAAAMNRPAVELMRGDAAAKLRALERGVVVCEGMPAFLAYARAPEAVFALPGSADATAALLHRAPRDARIYLDVDPDHSGAGYLRTLLRSLRQHEQVYLSARLRWYLEREPSGTKEERDAAEAKLRVELQALHASSPQLRDPDEMEDGPSVENRGFELITEAERKRLVPDGATAGVPVHSIAPFADAPIASDLVVPPGYSLRADGSLWTDPPPHSEAAPRQAASKVPLIGRVLVDVATHREMVEFVFRRFDAWKKIQAPRSVIGRGPNELAKLCDEGFPLDPSEGKDVARWLAQLELANEGILGRTRADVTGRCGWHELDGEPYFVIGSKGYGADGRSTSRLAFDTAVDNGNVVDSLYVSGGLTTEHLLAEHRAVVTEMIAASPAAAIAIYAALAAPLLRKVGAPNFGVQLVGPSSRGKTTALQGAGGIYGCPVMTDQHRWVTTWSTTLRGAQERAGLSCDLPLCIDEWRASPGEAKHDWVYDLIAGQGRTGAQRSGRGLRVSSHWRTALISTGEVPIADSRARAGAHVRLICPTWDQFGSLSGDQVWALKQRIEAHYGHLGHRWINHLLCVTDWRPHIERYRELVSKFRAQLERRSALEARQAEVYGVLALAEELAEEWLDMKSLGSVEAFVGDAEGRMGVIPEWRRALDVIRDRMASEPGAFPSLEPDPSGTSKRIAKREDGLRLANRFIGYVDPAPGLSVPVADDASPNEVKQALVKEALHLIPGPSAELLSEHGISLDAVLRDLRDEDVLVPSNEAEGRLRRRVSVDGIRTRVVTLRLDSGPLADPDAEPTKAEGQTDEGRRSTDLNIGSAFPSQGRLSAPNEFYDDPHRF